MDEMERQMADNLASCRKREEEAANAEQAGTLTPPVVEALVEARLFRAFLPASLGGLEADPLTLIEIVEAIASQDGSSGWCVGMGGNGSYRNASGY